MNWTKRVPAVDGYYWLRRAGEHDTIVKVRDVGAGLVEFGAMVAWTGSDWDTSLCEVLKKWQCSWAGPLLPSNLQSPEGRTP